MKKLWFKAKTYGWGWEPASAEGWIVVIAHFLITAAAAYAIFVKNIIGETVAGKTVIFVAIELVLTTALIIIAYRTGERPRWQWGQKSKQEQTPQDALRQ